MYKRSNPLHLYFAILLILDCSCFINISIRGALMRFCKHWFDYPLPFLITMLCGYFKLLTYGWVWLGWRGNLFNAVILEMVNVHSGWTWVIMIVSEKCYHVYCGSQVHLVKHRVIHFRDRRLILLVLRFWMWFFLLF